VIAGISLSLSLYINEIDKKPDLEVFVFSPSPYLGKVIFNFKNIDFSEPLELNMGVNNKGDEDSNSILLEIMFSKEVNITIKESENWYQSPSFKNYKWFHFEDRTLRVNKDTSRGIGNFGISIPKKNENLLIAHFILEGDFERKGGLISYNYFSQEYEVKHYTNVSEVVEIWNNHVIELNKRQIL